MSAAPAEAPVEGKKGGKKKLVVLVALVLLLGGGGAGAWFSGFLPKLLGKTGGEAAASGHGEAEKPQAAGHGAAKPEGGGHGAKPPEKAAEKPAAHGGKTEAAGGSSFPFMDLPDIVANLNSGPRRASFVKLRAKLELAKPEDQATLQAAMPRVLDLFQGYLREMRPEELRGTAGTYRLREELLARTNLAAPPARVVAVLFTEMLVQ